MQPTVAAPVSNIRPSLPSRSNNTVIGAGQSNGKEFGKRYQSNKTK
jgi:hypothetical protein